MAARKPIEALDQTHAQALDHLRELQRLPDHLQLQGIDAAARDTAARICAFFGMLPSGSFS